jgi:hypothetical protein
MPYKTSPRDLERETNTKNTTAGTGKRESKATTTIPMDDGATIKYPHPITVFVK